MGQRAGAGWERTPRLMSGPEGSAVTPVASARCEKEGVTEGTGEFQGGTAQEGLMLFREGMNKSWGREVNGGPDQPLCSAHCGGEIYGSGLPKPRTPHVDWLSAMKRGDKGRRQTTL